MSDTNRAQFQHDTPEQPSLEDQIEELRKQGAYPGEEGPEDSQETQGTPEGDEGTQETEEAAEERPEWLPEGFNSPEELAKAYEELASKGEETTEADEAAEEAVEKAGLNIEDLSAEYDETGSLSDKSYKALEEVGISRDVVDQYIEGQNARVQVYESEVMKAVGGEDTYQKLIKWAGQNLDADEIESFDKAVNSFDIKEAKFAVKSLKSRYDAKFGSDPQGSLDGRSGGQESGYGSTAEMERDMNDPRYHTDPAFRAKVTQKIANSTAI